MRSLRDERAKLVTTYFEMTISNTHLKAQAGQQHHMLPIRLLDFYWKESGRTFDLSAEDRTSYDGRTLKKMWC